MRGLSLNTLPNLRAPARRSRRCFMAVLALALSAVTAPFGSALAAQKSEASDKIIVTGASGQLAGEAIQALLGRGVKLDQLVLTTRTPAKLSSYASRGATVRLADFDKPETLEPAFAGGRDLLLISTNSDGNRLTQHTNAISAARKAGIRHIVYTSFTNATADNPALIARDHQLTEDVLVTSGVRYTILRNQLYMESLLEEAAQAIGTGDLYTNAARGKWAPVSREDCASAAAIVLTTPGHEGKTYDITGPELISHQDFALLIGDVLGRRVRVIEVDDATFVGRAMQSGMSESLAKLTASFGVAMRANSLNIRSEALQILLGRKPVSLRDLLLENKARLLRATPQLRAN